jgi:hypothetical protein
MQLTNIQINGDIIADILSNGEIQDQIEESVKKEFDKQKQIALTEFDSDKVTKELSNPEKEGNISMTLGGYGNLFGFIGFEAGFDPISPVRDALESKIKFKGTNLAINYPRNRKGQFATGARTKVLKINFEVPDLNDFDEAAQFQGWNGGRNWVKGIERGISGVSYYADYPRGRSERGLQLKGPITDGPSNRPSGFKTKPYITKIVNNFKKNFTNNIE